MPQVILVYGKPVLPEMILISRGIGLLFQELLSGDNSDQIFVFAAIIVDQPKLVAFIIPVG